MAKPPPGKAYLPQGWDLDITYKPIRNIWFRADSRQLRFRISAPAGISPGELDRAIRSKAGWMASRAARPAPPSLIPETLSNGDTCLVGGRLYPVRVVPESGQYLVTAADSKLEIHMKGPADAVESARMLSAWHRRKLGEALPGLLAVWEPVLGVRVNQCRIRRMKTRWGSCNIRAKRVWINLVLACLDPDLLEYVLVHELLHLLEPSHNRRFYQLMDRFLPDWKHRKSRLTAHAPGLA